MPTYTIKSPQGETLKVRGDKPPGPEDLDAIFQAHRVARYQREVANPEAKPSAGSSFASGVAETTVPGAKPGEGVLDSLKSAPGRILETLTDPEAYKRNAKAIALGPVGPILDVLGQGAPTDLGDAAAKSLQAGAGDFGTLVADIIKRGGASVGSGDPNEQARAGGNIGGLVLQALLAGKAPAIGEAAQAKVLPFVKGAAQKTAGGLASVAESPITKGALTLGSGAADLASGNVGQALMNMAAGKFVGGGALDAVAALLRKAGPKAEAGAVVAPEAASAATAPLAAEAAIAPKPPSIITDLEIKAAQKAAKGPVERHALREAKKAAEKGDESILRQLLGKPAENPAVASAAEQLGGLTPDSVAPQPQVPGPAASLEDLLRQSIRQRGGVPVDQAAPAVPPELAQLLLPDGQRAMPGGRSGLAVSESAPKLAAPAVGAETDLTELLLRSIAEAQARGRR